MLVYKGFKCYYLGLGRWRLVTGFSSGTNYLIAEFSGIAELIKCIDAVFM